MLTPDYFVDTEFVMLAKLAIAMLLGALIGTERAILAHQAAGTRTFGLVSLGAALFIIIGNFVDVAYIGVLTFDPMRTGAAVIMGLGFLAGGLIIFHKHSLHGMTTAAGLWIAAGIGMAVGFGMYAVAIFCTFLALVMFTAMWWLENRFKHWFAEVMNHDGDPTNGVRFPR